MNKTHCLSVVLVIIALLTITTFGQDDSGDQDLYADGVSVNL